MNFAGKVVLITGAASGIGAATAIEFAKLGAKLAIVDRNTDKLKEIADKCLNAKCKSDAQDVVQILADISIQENIPCVLKKTVCEFKRLDVLLNGVGILESGTIENTSIEQFDRMMNTNMKGAYQLTMLAIPELIKTKGNIVNISSICGMRSFPNVLAYNISKSAVDQFTRCVALELGAKGVRCNSVNPGVIATELHKSGGMDETAYKQFMERSKDTHALGRHGEANEVSSVICFLASEMASFITGVNLPVDGGRHAMCPR